MKLEFKRADFMNLVKNLGQADDIADQANARLGEMLKDAKVVYSLKNHPNGTWRDPLSTSGLGNFKALLINIEEIKNECEHEPGDLLLSMPPRYKCKHCGVELVAKWESK